MGRWLNNSLKQFSCRNRKFNSIVSVPPISIDKMAENFNTIFSNITSYKEEIASLTLYPFRIECADGTPLGDADNPLTRLANSRGTQIDIPAANINPKSSLRNVGYIYVPHISGNFLDYNGYTKYSLFLPFFSTIDIDASIFVDNYIVIRLATDFFTGQGMYIISMSKNEPTYVAENMYYTEDEEINEVFVANYVFNLGIDIPIGSTNVDDIKRNMALGTIKSALSLAAAAYGIMLPPATSISTFEESTVVSSRGNYKGARMTPKRSVVKTGTETTTRNTPKNVVKPISETISSGVSILNSNFIQGHGDRANNPMSMWSYGLDPYLIIHTPIVDRITSDYKHLKGLPLGLNLQLKQVSGFTKITDIHLEGINLATSEELNRIEKVLYEGVILPENETIKFYINDEEFVIPKGFTWEQFVKTQSTGIRLTGFSMQNIEYKYLGKWYKLDVYPYEIINDEEEIFVGDYL